MRPEPLETETPEEESRRMTPGQRLCIALALAALVGGGALLMLSCCPSRRPMPEVPPLPPVPEAIAQPEVVKVLIWRGPEMAVDSPAGGTWLAEENGLRRVVASGTGPWQVQQGEETLIVNGRPLGVEAAELHPVKELVEVGERRYRGTLLVRAGDEQLMAFNLVAPEAYLRSVVGSEMYVDWPMNALMAQAVAARTYMLYTERVKGYLGPLDMAYKGVEAENRSTDLAVRLTEGIVLTYNGALFSAYFHSTCGGHTVAAERVFDEEPLPPLSGVPCEWCRGSPVYRWRAVMPAARLAQGLGNPAVKTVRSIQPVEKGPEGYARFVVINGQVRMDANSFRLAVGSKQVKSARFTVKSTEDGFLFEGRGFGHGVGLCQWGAYGLAREGMDWQAILMHYYPGAEVLQLF
ncbi:MAG: SpoIID/LytB domain-containing protein [Candidatus Brocadiaceae bacterium]|jgi:stage II sporulation protein D